MSLKAKILLAVGMILIAMGLIIFAVSFSFAQYYISVIGIVLIMFGVFAIFCLLYDYCNKTSEEELLFHKI